jgi:hypothetical protein
MRPTADAVANVLEYPTLPFGAVPIAEKDPVQKAVLVLGHLSSFRLRGFPRTFLRNAKVPVDSKKLLRITGISAKELADYVVSE